MFFPYFSIFFPILFPIFCLVLPGVSRKKRIPGPGGRPRDGRSRSGGRPGGKLGHPEKYHEYISYIDI